MKKHMTQMELTKTRRLIESGITDIAEIQTYVFCDDSCIIKVLEQYEIEIPKPAAPPARKAVKKVEGAKAEGAAARLARKTSVDPIS